MWIERLHDKIMKSTKIRMGEKSLSKNETLKRVEDFVEEVGSLERKRASSEDYPLKGTSQHTS